MIRKKAFTLIELLVVIAIIGILATISVIALQNARAKSRDAKRAGDMKQIQTALELFFNDKNRYPTVDEWSTGQIYSTSTNSTSTYMQIIPTAPTPADGACTSDQNALNYTQTSNGASYTISFCLGNTTGSLVSGSKCSTPGGILDNDCGFHPCGGLTQMTYSNSNYVCTTGDTCIYDIVELAGYCWFKENLNIGSIISVSSLQTNNALFEKHCYNNHEVNPDPSTDLCADGENCGGCDTDGAMYQWNELMQYVETTGAQGMCPDGWHITTDAEQSVLEQYLTDPPNTCDVNRNGLWGCANAGSKLRVGGSSGFDISLSGFNTGGTSFWRGTDIYMWFSTAANASDAWGRRLGVSGPVQIDREDWDRSNGFYARCVKN
ncbi:hypothetical protein AUJ35_00975 [Candidatus Falkowbacteria bacterium CG1_02_41_21]|uniref:Fibrobacter succinogenes major paralogous domain-containing protein n=2 Tax=Candidatus Falkowiibacteriota TaxID=1752728 RepID=A0A1J4T9Q1_9BACT|nr:MAG: hypothetical protein AUJ35_00975 [Candidatus Falkowbacteria bacterium CG1_02_41_21]